MPQFFFDLTSGEDEILADHEGLALDGRPAAQREAEAIISELNRQGGHGRWAGWSLRVTDETDEFLVLPLDGLNVKSKGSKRR